MRAGFVQNYWELWGISNGSFPPPTARSWRGFFSGIFHETLIELQEVNLTKSLGGASLCLRPPGVFNSQSCLLWRFHQFINHSSHLLPALVPNGFCLGICAVTPCAHLSLQPGDSSLPGVLPSPPDLSRVVDFSVCLNFLFVRLEQWLPISLHVELKTGSYYLHCTKENLSKKMMMLKAHGWQITQRYYH